MQEPLSLVIFGASGDLTARKLVPALFQLFAKGRLPEEAQIIGVARSSLTDEEFRARLETSAKAGTADWQPARWLAFARRIHYVPGDAAQAGGLDRLRAALAESEGPRSGRRLYYLAVAPQLYGPIAVRLGEAGMSHDEQGWKRLVIEKPFGHDYSSARALNDTLHAHFREDQIFRIDHYLGKETVQNILVFRFANTLFEPVWNNHFIDHVQITVAEQVTIGRRGDYYDQAGVLRDMFQNHLLQVLTLVAMEAPARFAADALRNEKVKVLDAVPILTPEEATSELITGQYLGYPQEPGVARASRAATFAALRLRLDNWRWQGVPFYLRSGKGLRARKSEVVIQFRCPPHRMFPLPAGCETSCNRLTLLLQPDEGIHLSFQTKVPDEGMRLGPADLSFHYRQRFPKVPIPDAYERLLLDAIQGDASLFMRSDEIERAWEIIDPFIAATELAATIPETYAIGSEGPPGASALLAQDGRAWVSDCDPEAPPAAVQS